MLLCDFLLASLSHVASFKIGSALKRKIVLLKELILFFNPIALRKAKIVYNFGLSESNRVMIVYIFGLSECNRVKS